MSDPIAFFISFTCFGTWLHGDERGSVDLDHNIYGTPVLTPDDDQFAEMRRKLAYPPFQMNESDRLIVRDAFVSVCDKKGWTLWAAHVRTTHVHVVLTASRDADIDRVLNDLKTAASQRLNKVDRERRKRKLWTRHGSTRFVWNEAQLAAVINYILNRQGEPMALYAAPAINEVRPIITS